METLKEKARREHIPILRDMTAEALKQICIEKKPKAVLEIGTAIGYSGLLILNNSPCHLTTVEKDPIRATEACANFSHYGFSQRVTLLQKDALDALIQLTEEGKKFDLIFLDGPKGQYIKYYDFLKQLLGSQGILFADNVLLFGEVFASATIPHKHRSMVVNMRKFLIRLQGDTDFETKIYQIEDGYSISRLKK